MKILIWKKHYDLERRYVKYINFAYFPIDEIVRKRTYFR